ncbi:MAG: manganese efflux pump MntP family protein [Candidatus Vecturithrix sp.]|jgi:putative Mn2+ efflux pump MntP|nr:manganese efflux pump MntP family protein [Candidatus Vecturithrix sp.]
MSFLHTFALAVALAMDAFAVAVATGLSLKTVNFRQTFRLSWHFGLFQALMPMLGWSGGSLVRVLIADYDHWIACTLLMLVGGHIIKEALEKEKKDCRKNDPTKGITLIMLSVAVSIDALAIGLSLAMLEVSIFFPALIIGIVAFIFTVLGLHLGKMICRFSYLVMYAEIAGGGVLLLIGLNILRQHGVFSLN